MSEGSYEASLDSLEDSGASLASGHHGASVRGLRRLLPRPQWSAAARILERVHGGRDPRAGGPGRHPAEPHPPGGGHRGACPRPNPAVITPSLTSESQRPTTALSE